VDFVTDKEFLAALWRRGSQDTGAAPSPNRAAEQRRLHLDQLLDQALDESFPASDSPSIGNSS
jgi:hypothetical protein